MWRQVADFGRLQTAFVDEHGDFDTAAIGQVVDEAGVGHVAVDDAWLTRLHAVDDERAVFVAAVHFQRCIGCEQFVAQLVPAGDLVFAAADVLVERDVEFFDEFGAVALDEPGRIFGEVLA